MKTFATLIFTLLFTIFAIAQDKIAHTVKGKVINAASNQPVSYTNIGLEGTFFGTASDQEGNFELKIPESLVEKNIFFSAVGFKNRQFPVKTLFDKEFNVIKLVSQSYGVDEVDVAAQNMVLIRILRMASENIKYNYGAGPFNLHCSYSTEKSGNAAIADVLLYDKTGYAAPSKLDAFQARNYTVNKEKSDDNYRFSTNVLNIDELLDLDWARSASGILNPALLSDYKLSLKSQPTIDGKQYWVISFSQSSPTLAGSGDYYATAFEGEITINKEDYSVLKIDGKVKSAKNNRQGRGLAIGKSNKNYLSDVEYNFEVLYQDLLLSQVSINKKYSSEGKSCSENSVLKVKRAHSNNLTVVESRDYFPGE